jgi:ABC-type sugar transport system ATPase subunit
VLAGENGAGKSTLIRILSGTLTDFEGELVVRGSIATIHQELSLVEPMSVLDNLFLGEARGLFAFHSPQRRLDAAKRVLALMELDLDPHTPVESLPLAVRQLVEIARALGRDASVLVMDEPTSALSEPDVKRLFSTVERLKSEGRAIVFITHRLEEIFALADRITVLRDGRHVLTEPATALDPQKLVRAMVGRELGTRTTESHQNTRSLFAVRGLTLKPTLTDVSFELGAGEVVGIAGLRGSGVTELLHALSGATPSPFSGEALLDGKRYRPLTPEAALRAGVVLLPSDRRASVFSELSVRENGSLSSLGGLTHWGFVNRERERSAVAESAKRVALSAALETLAGSLSGGNQQKVALTRCLLARPRIVLCDEPTRGIDVAAKADVHALIRKLAGQGLGILFTSSELDELVALSDRVLVFSRGRLVETLGPGAARSTILQLAMGASA